MFVQFLPVFRRDAIDEKIGIVGRLETRSGYRRYSGQWRPGSLCDRQKPVRDLLKLGVQRQNQIVAQTGGMRFKPDNARPPASTSILEASAVLVFLLVMLFQAGFTNMVGAFVIGFSYAPILQSTSNRGQRVAQMQPTGMRGNCTEWVLTEQARFDLNAGKTVALGSEFGDLAISQASANRDRFKIFGLNRIKPALERLRSLGWMSMTSASASMTSSSLPSICDAIS